jgi:very-short-patch-repair endonuclease
MNERRAAQSSPPPRGAGAGGGGRKDSVPSSDPAQRADRPPSVRSADTSSARGEVGRSKRAKGWAPDPNEGARQKDRTRTKLRAKELRKELTPSEKKLWLLLREIEGARFRKEVAIGDYVFDFACYGARLLIEIDGSIHERADVQLNDKAKTIYAATQGFRVLRFQNNDVWDRPAWVLAEVRARLDAPHPPTPSPQGRGGESEQ